MLLLIMWTRRGQGVATTALSRKDKERTFDLLFQSAKAEEGLIVPGRN